MSSTTSLPIQQILGLVLAPVIMIAATGLLSYAIYQRLAAAIDLVHEADHRSTKIITRKVSGSVPDNLNRALDHRLRSINSKTKTILKRANLLKVSMTMFFVGLILFVLAVIAGILAIVNDGFYPTELAFLIVGMFLVLIGAIISMQEVGKVPGRSELEFLDLRDEEQSSSGTLSSFHRANP